MMIVEDKKNLLEQVVDVAETASPTIVKKKWTIKRVLLYVVTLYFVLLILKFVFKVIWKGLNLLRVYIHNLTDEKKIVEVILWTFVGIVVGVLLNKQIINLWDTAIDFFNNVFLPWVINL